MGATGIRFDEVEVTTSKLFQELYPNRQLPKFVWLQIKGRPGRDDFGIGLDPGLVISERALEVLRKLGISNALITGYKRGFLLLPASRFPLPVFLLFAASIAGSITASIAASIAVWQPKIRSCIKQSRDQATGGLRS
jgi:hypothetical protein